MKFKTIIDLSKALDEAGLPSSIRTIKRWETKGLLSFRRTSHLQEYNRRLLTDKDIKQIVKAFSPLGRGRWSYDKKR